MALIRKLEETNRDRLTLHDPIDAKYLIFERDGKVVVQIDTYGRATREMPEKVSQSIQFDESSGRELARILQVAFNNKR